MTPYAPPKPRRSPQIRRRLPLPFISPSSRKTFPSAMSRNLLKRTSLYARRLLPSPPIPKSRLPIVTSTHHHRHRCFSSSDSQNPPPPPTPPATAASSLADLRNGEPPVVADVNNQELKRLIEQYFKGDEQVLPSIAEAILRRRLLRKHDETDDEMMEEMRMRPLTDVKDREFDSDLDEALETDEEIDNLYNARDYVQHKMASDPFFNMDDRKWDEMIREATDQGFLKDTRECEEILEDMLNWDKLLPDEIKRKVELMVNELGDMCEKGEMEPEQAYELFKAFEDKMVLECAEMMKAEPLPEEEEIAETRKKKVHLDDPPGEGPVLRWESRVVFAPGGDAWHPKNRKVKLSVSVKELELSRHAFCRLRELVGKRYHPGSDELTITSERFEHREENRKDCLRTLYALIEEAMKGDKIVDEARKTYVKDRLRANPQFMERLKTKAAKMQESRVVPP